jgi:class 3 adenylate cyclase
VRRPQDEAVGAAAPPTVPVSDVSVRPEAIAIVDLVQSTAVSDLFGWYAVGRGLVRELRKLIEQVGEPAGLCCVKGTGDGYLLAYASAGAAELAAVRAVGAAFALLESLAVRNAGVPEEHQMDVRIAVHFGQVDVLEADREGPHVAYAFRLAALDRSSLSEAYQPIDPDAFPLRNYVLCSESVAGILGRRESGYSLMSCGLFKLKGFLGSWEVFLMGDKPVPAETVTGVGR